MNEWLSGSILTLYYLILGVLACYGAHRLALVVTFWRTRRMQPSTPEPPAQWPMVTVQLPIFNEMYVAERLIEAVCRLDYSARLPRDPGTR